LFTPFVRLNKWALYAKSLGQQMEALLHLSQTPQNEYDFSTCFSVKHRLFYSIKTVNFSELFRFLAPS
jgi:hypothetical protein